MLTEYATEIKIRAERKAGEMLRDAKAAGTVATVNDGGSMKRNSSSCSTSSKPVTLSEIGITAAIRYPFRRKQTAQVATSGHDRHQLRRHPTTVSSLFRDHH
jgi:hypothetical protein